MRIKIFIDKEIFKYNTEWTALRVKIEAEKPKRTYRIFPSLFKADETYECYKLAKELCEKGQYKMAKNMVKDAMKTLPREKIEKNRLEWIRLQIKVDQLIKEHKRKK